MVEDDTDIRQTVSEYLNSQPEIKVVRTAESVEEFLHYLPQIERLDLVLLDLGLPGMSGIEGIEAIHDQRPETDIIILSAFQDYDRIYKALCAGAVAYLSKRERLAGIKEAVMVVFKGGSYMSPEIARQVVAHFSPRRPALQSVLTPRQSEIVQGLVDGLSYKLIADQCDISVETVRDHIKKIYKKLQVNSKAEVIRKRLDGEI